MKIKAKVFEIIQPAEKGGIASRIFDAVIMILIFISIASVFIATFAISRDFRWFLFRVEKWTVLIFTVEYLLRIWTADLLYPALSRWRARLAYVKSPMAIIDLLSILPGFSVLGRGFKIFRITRLLRLVRLLKLVRYSSKIQVLARVVRKEKKVLITVLGIAIFYVFLTALIMFNAEPRLNPETGEATFDTFFDALYWATVTLTTVGYGDMIPVTNVGRFVSMLSALFGVAIIALPSGVITASYLDEIRSNRKRNGKEVEKEAEKEADNSQT